LRVTSFLAHAPFSPQREKREDRREALRQQLRDVEQSLKQETVLRAEDARQSARHSREKTAVAGGKKPFYLKKAAAKQDDLLAKFNELKASGRLDTFLAKRRQKLATKDHVHAPGTRRGRMGREEEEP
jgi:ribosomal RNA-processing protein 36